MSSTTTAAPSITVTAQSTLFTHEGTEYYLVFFRKSSTDPHTFREPKTALIEAKHKPAHIVDDETVLGRSEILNCRHSFVVYDYQPFSPDGILYALSGGKLGFYRHHIDTNRRGQPKPALCERPISKQ